MLNFRKSQVMAAFACSVALLGLLALPSAQALKLSDLVKQQPLIYLPSQIIPGRSATFTVKGRPGHHVRLFLSSQSKGKVLNNGVELRVGKPTLEAEAVIPASGVVDIRVEIPKKLEEIAEKQYVDAMVWSDPSEVDAQGADVFDSTGVAEGKNIVMIGQEADPGSTLIIPGEGDAVGLMRSLGQLNDVKGDPRKKALIDTGNINQERQLDKTLGVRGGR